MSLDPADPIAGPDECAARGDDHAYVARTCRDALRAKPRCLWAAVRLAPAASRLGDHEAAVARAPDGVTLGARLERRVGGVGRRLRRPQPA